MSISSIFFLSHDPDSYRDRDFIRFAHEIASLSCGI